MTLSIIFDMVGGIEIGLYILIIVLVNNRGTRDIDILGIRTFSYLYHPFGLLFCSEKISFLLWGELD